MSSVGKLLRGAREEQHKSIAQIADELCITQRYLRAIEDDDLASLPGAFFYKSFVRQYAVLVGVEPRKIQDAVDALAEGSRSAPVPTLNQAKSAEARSGTFSPWLLESIDLLKESPRPSRTAPPADPPPVRTQDPLVQDFNRYFSDRRIGMSVASLAVALLACSGFYAWWVKVPEPSTAAPSAPSQTVKTEPARSTNGVSGQPAVTVATMDSDGVNHAVLDISATEKTWLSITSEGKLIFSGILEPSQTKTLTGVERAQMKVGNAGGLEVRWKGKPIGPIGPRGQVRTVVFKTDDVEILSAPQEPDSSSEL
jgi:cytoskeleton protein RodZ